MNEPQPTPPRKPPPSGWKQKRHPVSLQRLYQKYSGDADTDARVIARQFRTLNTARQRIVRARLKDEPYPDIGEREGITGGAAHKAVFRAMEAMRKAIHNEPRYNKSGHPGGGKKPPKSSRAANSPAQNGASGGASGGG